jgi:acyl carrier protein
MDREDVLGRIRTWIVDRVLEGRDVGLTNDTPLLEWGVINSLELVRLAQFVRETFGVEIPNQRLVAKNFRDLNAVTDLVLELGPKS